MGILHFVKGTYHNKVGDVVGVRKGSTSVVRQYVIPSDPKTPAQLAQRAKFAQGEQFVNYAMQLNRGAKYWKVAGGEKAARLKTYFEMSKMGGEWTFNFPVVPYGFTPDVLIGDVPYWWTFHDTRDTSIGSGVWYYRAAERTLAYACAYLSVVTGNVEVEIGRMSLRVGESISTWTAPENINRNSYYWIVGISIDDDRYGGQVVYLPPCRGHYYNV